MVFGGVAPYLGGEVRARKDGSRYAVVRVVETNGRTFEGVVRDAAIINQVEKGAFPQFGQVSFEVNVSTGKYINIEFEKLAILK